MKNQVNFGIVGLDHWYLAHACAELFPKLDRAKIAAVADKDGGKAKEFAERYGIEKWYDNYKSLMEQPSIDAVIICTSNNLNAKVAANAIEAKKHVLCNKPVGITLKDANELVKLVNSTDIKFMVAFIDRFGSQYVKARELIAQGAIGSPLLASIESYSVHGLPKSAPDSKSPGWFIEPEKAGGGVLIDTGIYDIDLMRWCLKSEVKKVYAEIGTLIYEGLEVEDYAKMIITFENGAFGAIGTSWASIPGPSTYHPHQPRLRVFGTDGTLLVDSLNQPLTICGRKEPFDKVVHYDLSESPLDVMVKRFIDCIIEDKPSPITAEDGKAALEVVLAGYLSAKTGAAVKLPLN